MPAYLDAALTAMPILVLGTACLVLRAYYFGQVIYFTGSARREVLASLLMLAIAVAGCLTLVPAFGLLGAATTFAATQAAGLIYFLWADRTSAIMPIDWQRGGIAIGATTGTALTALLAMLVLGGNVGWFVGLMLTLAGGLALAVAWNLFDLGRLAAYLLARLTPSSRRS